jgi:hypothetical protein
MQGISCLAHGLGLYTTELVLKIDQLFINCPITQFPLCWISGSPLHSAITYVQVTFLNHFPLYEYACHALPKVFSRPTLYKASQQNSVGMEHIMSEICLHHQSPEEITLGLNI